MIDKIYISRKSESKDDANLFVSIKGKSIYLTLKVNDVDYFYSLDVDEIKKRPEIINLGFSVEKGIYQFTATECRESRSGLAFILETNAGHCMYSMSNIGAFWIPKNKSDKISCFFNAHCNVWVDDANKSKYQVINGYRSSNKVFNDFIPSSRDYIKRLDAKRNLLKKINELDSLAMLEAQLDLLTRYVLTGEGKDLLERSTDGCLSTSLHDDEKIFKTIKDQKEHLRNIQREYFKER